MTVNVYGISQMWCLGGLYLTCYYCQVYDTWEEMSLVSINGFYPMTLLLENNITKSC